MIIRVNSISPHVVEPKNNNHDGFCASSRRRLDQMRDYFLREYPHYSKFHCHAQLFVV